MSIVGPDGPLKREWRAPYPVDVPTILSVHRRGPRDPAFRIDATGAVWRTSLTPAGPGTISVRTVRASTVRASTVRASTVRASTVRVSTGCAAGEESGPRDNRARHDNDAGTVVGATAWGPGAAWLLDQLPGLLGAADDPAGFVPVHPLLRELASRHRGTRIGRSARVLEALVPAVLEQKVVGLEAHRAWRVLLLRHGLPAPGPAPAGMRVFPPARVWSRLPSWEWHQAGVEAVRARTIAGAASVAGRLEEIGELAATEADRRLRALPGIGPWTSAEVRQRACGDADAVSVGDYSLPAAVGWALAGRIVDDAGMLELLAPYPGHRHRAARLIELSGARPPRRGPRMAVRDYRGR